MNSSPFKNDLNLSDLSLLIVDDSEAERVLLRSILEQQGIFNITEVGSANEAIQSFGKNKPELIICNISIPQVDGIEFCRQIRASHEIGHVPIIMYSNFAGDEQRTRCFEAGAIDLIQYPISDKELRARIVVHLTRVKAFQKLENYRAEMQTELEQARHMHLMLLPTATDLMRLKGKHGVVISQFFEPCSELGGDIWDVFTISENRLGFYICDFTGHGVGPAINTFRLHMLMSHFKKWYDDPGELLSHLNTHLYKILPAHVFVTFFYGVIDTAASMLYYATAGAPSPYLYRHKQAACEQIDGAGLPLAVVRGQQYKTASTTFQANDTLCMYSDALLASLNAPGSNTVTDAFMQEYIMHHMHSADDNAQRSLIRTIIQQLGIMTGAECADDLTIALMTRLR